MSRYELMTAFAAGRTATFRIVDVPRNLLRDGTPAKSARPNAIVEEFSVSASRDPDVCRKNRERAEAMLRKWQAKE